jgi:hypothetical protein
VAPEREGMITETYHKLVKTTPNPSATKNKRGELVAEPELLLPLVPVVVAALLAAEVVDAFILEKRMSGVKGSNKKGSEVEDELTRY